MQQEMQNTDMKRANNTCNTLCAFSVLDGYMNGMQTILNRMFIWFSRFFAFVAILTGTTYTTEHYKLARNINGSFFKSFIKMSGQNFSSNLFEFQKFGFIKIKRMFLMMFAICLILLFAGIAVADAAEPLPPKAEPLPPNRFMYVNDWGGIYDTEEKLKAVIDDAAYMNCDAVLMIVWSDYFEAVRDPVNKGSWDSRDSWDMVGTGIQYAHSKDMQFHVWIPINYVNSVLRAESRLFGKEYNVVRRDGSVHPTRTDLAFKEIFDYEIELMEFIAGHYPDLDGLQIEEPLYPYTQSYTTVMRDRIKSKYGYDPLDKPEEEMKPIINKEMGIVMNDFFTELRAVTRAANPNLQLSANALYYYSGHTGFDPVYMAENDLLDWYGAQIYRDTADEYRRNIESFAASIDEIPIAAITGITYSRIYPDSNPAFFDQVEQTHDFGADITGIFTYNHRNYLIDGATAMDGLHAIEPTPTPSQSPVFNTIGDKSINEGFRIEFTISATDPNGDSLTYSTENLPSGATFDPATQVFSWTPIPGQSGAYSVRFVVSDGHLTDAEDITVLVNSMTPQYMWIEAEAVDEISPVMGVVSDPSASGGSYVGAPEGTGFSALGHTKHTIFIPAQGTYKVCGRVHAPDTNSNSFFVRVDDGSDMTWAIPVTDSWAWGEVSHWGSGTETNPEIDPVIFSLSAGEHVVIVKHREAGTKLDRLLITNDLTYVPHDTTPPVADAGQDQTVHRGAVVYFDGSGSTDNVGIESYSWDFDASDDLPQDATGVTASHIYTEPSSYIVTLTVTDTCGSIATDTCMVTVSATTNLPPTFATIPDQSVIHGHTLFFTTPATDPNNDSMTFSAQNLPPSAHFTASNQTFAWTPTYENVTWYTDVRFIVSDGDLTDTETIMIFPRWDVDRNGVVNEGDRSLIEAHFGQPESACLDCDVNLDDEINIIDYSLTGQHIDSHWENPPIAYEPTSVRILPESLNVAPGENFLVTVSVTPGTSIAGMQFNLGFDATLLSVNSVAEGDLLSQNESLNTSFIGGTINNTAGTITNVFGCILGPYNATAPGTFAIINMTAKDSFGTSDLNLTGVVVSDPYGHVADTGVTNGMVTVGDASTPVIINLRNDTLTSHSVNLIWGCSAPDIDHYTIYQDGALLTTTEDAHHNVVGLAPATTYTFSVSATTTAGITGENATITARTLLGASPDNILHIPGDITASPGNSVTVPIMLSGATGVACTSVKLTYDVSVVTATDATQGDFTTFFGFDDEHAADGWVTINTYIRGTQRTGDVTVAYVTLVAVGNAGDTSPLDMEIISMADQNGYLVSGTVDNGLFTVAVDNSPPLVTDMSASQLIPDDTDGIPLWGETATLTVTVTDDSAIANVTTDLSAIGGSPVQPMTNLWGNVWYVATNASAGTLPRTYALNVCATDIHGYTNMSESIQLVVMRNGDVTGDGDVTPADVILLDNYATHPDQYTISSDFVADVSGDGVVDLTDAMLLANYVMGQDKTPLR